MTEEERAYPLLLFLFLTPLVIIAVIGVGGVLIAAFVLVPVLKKR